MNEEEWKEYSGRLKHPWNYKKDRNGNYIKIKQKEGDSKNGKC